MTTAVLLTVAIVVLGAWLTYATRAVESSRMEKTFPHPVTCQVQRCRRPVSHRYARHPSGQVLYICVVHASQQKPYDQDTDVSLWERDWR
jgi:hypothetical protein